MQFDTWLERYYFEKYILDVAIGTLEQGGVTSNVATYQFLPPIDAWGIPKYPGKTVILTPEANIAEGLVQFIERHHDHLCEADTWLGTWVNPQTRCCHLDITVIYSRLEDAKREAWQRGLQERRNVVALYNFKHGQTVFLEQERSSSSL
ncbi:MAG: hypothetical protein J2P37_12685 [Ktedonobacteraceae bacterium]|nr:hypothetical protein [Ktedonobacteraceae bacterium]MBO0794532.1 hypothetical protein [Ktedonobacteraceae bacterium]